MARHLLSFSEESAFAKLVDANVAAIAQAQQMDGPPVVITCSSESYGKCFKMVDLNDYSENLISQYGCKWTGMAQDNCSRFGVYLMNVLTLIELSERGRQY